VLILLSNLAILVGLVVYLYRAQHGPEEAQSSLAEYLGISSRPPRSSSSSSVAGTYAMTPLAKDDSSTSVQGSMNEAADPEAKESSVGFSPLSMLVFHSQQLSLLLLTSASLPTALAGLLAVFSSGSQGFSLSSLTAMECLTEWKLKQRCWAAVAAPLVIGFAAFLTYMRSCWRRHRHASDSFGTPAEDLSVASRAAISATSRMYSVYTFSLYLLVFPCAQTTLTALGCTDWREVGDGVDAGQESRVYLNLAPWQECDQQWREEILPPALLGAFLWCLLFPVISTLWLRHAHMQLSSENAESGFSSRGLHAWTVSSELLKPYKLRLWFWEQVLLLRRLLLVATVTLVQQHSVYLPLLLLAIVQLSALLQHYSRPYRSSWLNLGELWSLYMLLVTYSSAVVESSAGSSRSSVTGGDEVWQIILFLANLLFLLVLLLSLFAVVRNKIRNNSVVQRCMTALSGFMRWVGGSGRSTKEGWQVRSDSEASVEEEIKSARRDQLSEQLLEVGAGH
jgi:hypothetical protein